MEMSSQTVRPGERLAHPAARWRSVTELLDARAAAMSSAPAIAFPGNQHTYAEVASSSLLASRRLKALGVAPGDRVGILLREACEPYVTLSLGIMRLGAICVPINARNKTHELSYVIEHAGLRALLIGAEFADLVAEANASHACEIVVIGHDARLEGGGEQISHEAVGELERSVGPDSPALMLYTSGTTANPKGVLHPHATLLATGYNTSERLELSSEDRYWTPLAMFHVGGWQVMMSAFAVGGCFSHIGMFEATAALDQLERERVTVAMPAFELIWLSVLDHPRFPNADLSALRTVMNVGVPERLERMQAMLPQAVQISMFGMTESCGSICIGSRSDSLQSRTRSSGRPLRGIEVRVVDPETGEDCAPGVPGELRFRGVTRFVEYYRDPDTTASVIDAAGWARTGDLVRRESDGTVAFVSRLKDMLKVGGENASAAEIEGYLITHPAVTVASVVAAPDARYGEVAAAFVQTAPGAQVTEEELIDYCVGSIATFKVPRYIRFVDDFPVSASQKIQKYALRERIESELQERGITEAPKLVGKR
jgi:fatty-acyl-CoA synthase